MMREFPFTGQDIVDFRTKKGLSQQIFASMLGVSVATISRWENDVAKPTGTAAAVLTTVIGGVATTPGAEFAASGIYRLLKEAFGD